jgi:hypothetical protein
MLTFVSAVVMPTSSAQSSMLTFVGMTESTHDLILWHECIAFDDA